MELRLGEMYKKYKTFFSSKLQLEQQKSAINIATPRYKESKWFPLTMLNKKHY